jgi:hypothetical protein
MFPEPLKTWCRKYEAQKVVWTSVTMYNVLHNGSLFQEPNLRQRVNLVSLDVKLDSVGKFIND